MPIEATLLRLEGKKRCSACGGVFTRSREFFYFSKGYPANSCIRCDRERVRAWSESHPEQTKLVRRLERERLRSVVLSHYSCGVPSCACCGENALEFLAIDHIDGGGAKQKRELGGCGSRLYRWLRQNHYPEGYRVLCHNCNASRGLYGYCPHTHLREVAV